MRSHLASCTPLSKIVPQGCGQHIAVCTAAQLQLSGFICQFVPDTALYRAGHCSASGTPWQYLTVQLTRESEDLAGDPDLYGLFYGGTAGAVGPCRALRVPMEAQPPGAHAFLAQQHLKCK